MRASALSALLLAAAALASPMGKRDTVVKVDVVVTTVWVTSGHHHHTPPASSSSSSSSSTAPAVVMVVTTTTAAPPAPPALPAVSSTTQAPPPPPVSASVVPSPASSSAAPSAAAATDYISQILYHHNAHRANHSASDLTWDDSLATTAGKTASTCVFAHDTVTDSDNGNNAYGQNIAAGTAPENIGQVITIGFYNHEVEFFNNYYGQPNPPGSEQWGHFSQVVWKATSSVGCATQYCPNGVSGAGQNVLPYFTVCNYKTPGNVGGAYGDNIGQPLGQPYMSGQ